MKQRVHSIQFERKRKFLLAAPFIVSPFLIFILWVLGLVGPAETMGQSHRGKGLNLTLPAPIPTKDSSWDKLQFYEQADKDSAKLRQLQKQDPYFNKRKAVAEILRESDSKARYQSYPDEALNEADEQEKKVYEKISAIHRQIDKPNRRPKPVVRKTAQQERRTIANNDVDRLERMMAMMNSKQAEEDPEMQQINALMEKIMDIQHPERVSEHRKQLQAASKAFAVTTSEPVNKSTPVETNRFYSLDDEQVGETVMKAIAAVVQEDQQVQAGSVVKIRLTQSIFINSIEIPENQFVYGIAKLNANRMLINVTGIQYRGIILPVSLGVYASDGMEGIPVQTSELQQAMDETMDRSLQSIGASALDINAGAQVAGAALQAGKSLLKKQHKAVSVQVPAGYSVSLVNHSSNN